MLGANGVFLLERLDPLQDTVEFGDDGVEFFIQLLVHPFVHGFENDVGLIGQQSLHLLFRVLKRSLNSPLVAARSALVAG